MEVIMLFYNCDRLKLYNSDRVVRCPRGGFTSTRMLIKDDNMGFTITKTEIPKGDWQKWHYKNHLEACYCISGHAIVVDIKNNERFEIKPGDMYALNEHDEHKFKALENTVLICVFNPPLIGNELHDKNGSYILVKK